MKLFKFFAITLIGFVLSSCATIFPNGAFIYQGTTNPVAVTSNEIGNKVGSGKTTNILGLINIGDGSINQAARMAGITKISHVDVKTLNVLGIFRSQTFFVYGE